MTIIHAFEALELRDSVSRSLRARRGVIEVIQSLLTQGQIQDELQDDLTAELPRMLQNFEMGDDAANGEIIRNLIFSLADTVLESGNER